MIPYSWIAIIVLGVMFVIYVYVAFISANNLLLKCHGIKSSDGIVFVANICPET
jgi:Na+/pantothenate symporter